MPEWLNFALGVVGMIVIPLGTLQLTLHQRSVIAQKKRTKKIKRRLNHHDDCLDIVKKEVRALSMHRRVGDNGNGAKLAVGLATGLAGLICLLSGSAIAQPVPPVTQCVTSALAGGTPDALTLPLLPCSVTSTLVIVTLSHTNQTTSPTIQMVGARAEPVVNFDGSSPFVGELLAGSQLIFTNSGSAWIVLTGSGTPTGITELTGDATAGPGTGSQVLTLANTAVTPGSYTLADVTFDSKGRATSAASYAGTSGAAHQYMIGLSGTGTGSFAQPSCGDLSDAGAGCAGAAGGVSSIANNDGTLTISPTTGSAVGSLALSHANSWTGAQRGTPTNIAISTATFTPNFNTGQNFEVDLTSACPCTLANPSTTLVAGQSGMIEVHQDGSGSRTIGTWGSDYQYVGGTSTITLSTTASAVDYLPYYVNNAATGIVLGAIIKVPAH